MKNILVSALLAFSTSAISQMVNEDFESDLEKRHPKATAVNWIPGDGIYTAEFQTGDRKMKAIYTQQGEWLRSIMQIPVSEIPDDILKNITPGLKVTGAAKVMAAKQREGKYILQLEGVYSKKGELQKEEIQEE
ncbi:MAG: hypothetical protein U5L96_04480 [Owenweeksia sp.]|nr:hypothetical protein [Owenweeksia sp.]